MRDPDTIPGGARLFGGWQVLGSLAWILAFAAIVAAVVLLSNLAAIGDEPWSRWALAFGFITGVLCLPFVVVLTRFPILSNA